MALSAIIALIILGIVLILLEFFVVPGITIAGVGGLLMLIGGVFMAYSKYGTPGGHYVLAGTVFALILVLYGAFKSKTWEKIALNTEINSQAKEDLSQKITLGDKGKSISRLAPRGTVSINGLFVEAESINGLIDENEDVEVIKVKGNKIIVKLKK
ncbi:MAG: hypothetical protein L3J74_16665 [Bacteroidales bacterium]|nr:hypothetical protein [Bacteroidales bacterium]